MSDTEAHAQAARAFLRASASHDSPTIAALLADDATYWTAGTPRLFNYAGERNKAEIVAYMATPSIFIGGASVRFGAITAEGDRVAVECETFGTLADGRVYTNAYHYLFTFRDGLIRQVKEYLDTAAAAEFFAKRPD
jgi:ketosteroid isomerase-like protein